MTTLPEAERLIISDGAQDSRTLRLAVRCHRQRTDRHPRPVLGLIDRF